MGKVVYAGCEIALTTTENEAALAAPGKKLPKNAQPPDGQRRVFERGGLDEANSPRTHGGAQAAPKGAESPDPRGNPGASQATLPQTPKGLDSPGRPTERRGAFEQSEPRTRDGRVGKEMR